MFDRLTLADELTDCRGAVLGRRGQVVSPETIAEAAQRAPALPRRTLAGTPLEADAVAALDDPACAHLFPRGASRDAVGEVVLAVRLPDVLHEELLAARHAAPALHRHAFATAAIAVRMLQAAVAGGRGTAEVAAAALLHDLGMRHLPARILKHKDRLAREEAHRVAAHPLLGAYHLACVLGVHPAVAAARSHHWRCGQGYPRLAGPPARSIEVISVASAFAALTQPRPYRSAPFDARGAVDVLVAESVAGRADATTVKLLVHALRGGRGDPRSVRFAVGREGHAPEVNRHTAVSPPDRSPL